MPQSGKKRKTQKDIIVELRQELERAKNENQDLIVSNQNLIVWNQQFYQKSTILS